MELSFYESTVRLLFAAILGAAIGYEREKHSQPAGLRTHMIVAVASALITIVSYEMGKYAGADPSRIAAQIVSGIGFLGAGAIIKYGASIRGLTTAASLWAVAGIGMAAGMALFLPAIVTTVLIFISLWLVDEVLKIMSPGKEVKKIHALFKSTNEGTIGKIESIFHGRDIDIKNVGVNKLIDKKQIRLTIVARIPEQIDLEELAEEVSKVEGLMQFEIE